MHIVIVPSWYPNNENDLSGIFFRDQGIALQKDGHKVTVAFVETRSVKKIFNDLFQKKEWRPCSYISHSAIKEYRSRIYNLLLKIPYGKEWLIYLRLKKQIELIEEREGKIDIIHLHSFVSHGLGVSHICNNKKIPYVMTEHYSKIDSNTLKWYQNRIIKRIGNTASYLIAVGDGGAEYIRNLTGRKVEVIPNMVNVSQFTPKTISLKSKSNGIKILSVGHLNYRKGFDLLIQAFTQVHKRYPEAELTIAGGGCQLKNLKNQIRNIEKTNSSIQGKIKLIGEVQRNDLPELIESSSLFALASRDEPFGVVLIEALAMGKPVVATANMGPRKIVNNDCGLLVENNNATSIASGIIDLIENLNAYDSAKIRDYCIKNFSETTVVKKLNDIYFKIVYNN
ncbi:MAG: glycosyltransferase [Spirochaetales bacterium]|nr:glycosyltransferase [Spirochaetales bacterium]